MSHQITTPYKKSNPESIQQMFGKIARTYDRGNAILSMQMHRLWNRSLIKRVLEPCNPQVMLDLCCGTGAIAYGYLKRQPDRRQVYLLDFCKEMLDVARYRADEERVVHHALNFLQADAQQIPLADNSIDCATVAYGIRNVADPRKCIREVHRVLRHGGSFGILELTRPGGRVLRYGHRLYLENVLPRVGKWVLGEGDAYTYLCNSIEHFSSPDELVENMLEVGFEGVTATRLTCGVATIIEGKKA